MLFYIAFLLYLSGVIGVLVEGPGEFWLWFLSFGVLMDLTLFLLSYLGSKKLSAVKKVDMLAKVAHFLVFPLAGLAFYFRLKAEISSFSLVVSIILIIWTYSIFKLHKSWRRQVRNE